MTEERLTYQLEEPVATKRNGSTYLTVTELADRLNVHRNTVLYWIEQDQLRAIRFGLAKKSPWMIPEEEAARVVRELGGQ
jgi:excisionase family DNA binding protein